MSAPSNSPAELARSLREALGADSVVLDEPSVRRLYSRDLAEIPALMKRAFFLPVPDVVVQPRHPAEVAAVVRFANARRVAIVPRGAGSSGFWGSVPARAGISIDLSPMDAVESIDPEARTITVQAGAKWHDVDRRAGQHGLTLFTTPSSRYSTVAGWVATGGYGVDSYRYGHLSRHVVSIEVVTPTGEVRTVRPDEADYALYSGTEGQLGIVTRVTLRLRPRPARTRAFLLLFDTPAPAFRFIAELAGEPVRATHVVYLDEGHLHEINEVHRVRKDTDAVLVPEHESVLVYFDDLEAAAAFERTLEERLVRHGGAAAERHVANLVFNDRFLPLKAKKLGPELMGAQVVLDLDGAPAYVEAARRIAARYGAAFSAEAHVLDTPDGPRALVMAILPVAWRGVPGHFMYLSMAGLLTWEGIRRGGKPYSIGVWNAPFKRLKWDAATWERLVRAKREHDPNDVLNPGKFPTVRSRLAGLPALLLRPTLYKVAMESTRLLSFLAGWLGLARLLSRRVSGRIDAARPLVRSAAECTYCGACQPVCPAWLVTRDERVVARSKLQVGARLAAGLPVDPEEARMAFVCLHCGECTRVCQAILPLVPVWDELEAGLAARFGWPRETVDTFLADLATNRSFQERLLVHDPTLYGSISDTRRRIELPLAAAGESAARAARG